MAFVAYKEMIGKSGRLKFGINGRTGFFEGGTVVTVRGFEEVDHGSDHGSRIEWCLADFNDKEARLVIAGRLEDLVLIQS